MQSETKHCVTKPSFSSNVLFGRRREVEVFEKCLDGCKTKKQLVLVGGEAGVGKTVLAHHLQKKTGVLYSHGKYTIGNRNEPFGALAQVCRSICEQLPDLPSFDSCIEELRTDLGLGDTLVLFRLLPCIPKLIGEGSERAKATTQNSFYIVEDQTKLYLALRRFFRVVSRHVLLIASIDDAQWADQDSLDALEFLLTDSESSYMIICCYRSDEIDDGHKFHRLVTKIESISDNTSVVTVTRLEVGNLGRDAVLKLFCASLQVETSPRTEILVDMIFELTNGNPFFVRQFLLWLLEENVLEKTASSWYWDFNQVRLTIASDSCDLASVIKSRLGKFSIHVQNLFKLASFLGTEIDSKVFGLVVADYFEGGGRGRNYFGADVATARHLPLQAIIEMGVSADFFFCATSKAQIGTCKWQHDKVQEAIHNLVSPVLREQTSLKIGQLLRRKLSKTSLDANIYLVAGLLNAGARHLPTTSSADRLSLAEINLVAGKRSIHASAFEQATDYFCRGIFVLPRNGWRVYSEVALDLYSHAGESSCCIGHLNDSEKYCKAVITRAGIPLIAKRRAYSTLIRGLLANGKPEEVIKTCIDLLGLLNHQVPKRFLIVRAVPSLLRAKARAKDLTTELEMRMMQDGEKMWVMSVLGDMFVGGYLADRDDYLVTSVVRSFEFSAQHGLCNESPVAIARMGLVLATSLRAYQEGLRYGEYALTLLTSFDDKRIFSMTYLLVYGAIWHWQRKLDWRSMRAGYLAGMAVGETETACFNGIFDILFRLFTGSKLLDIFQALERYVPQYVECNQAVRVYGFMQQQMVANLLGESAAENTVILSGNYMDSDVVNKDIQNGVYGKIEVIQIGKRSYEMILAFFFDDFERFFEIRRLANERLVEQMSTGQFFPVNLKYMVGIAAVARFRQTRKRKYRRLARRLYRKMWQLHCSGVSEPGAFWLVLVMRMSCSKLTPLLQNPNVRHYVSLMKAELLDISNDPRGARGMYDQAISQSRGIMHDHATAEQKLAEFYLRQGELTHSRLHLKNAIELYQQWGSKAKVRLINEKYQSLLKQADT